MGMSVGGAHVAVIESGFNCMRCEAYPSKLAAVLAMMNNGSLGAGGGGYGSAAHKAALDAVEKQLAETRAIIAEQDAREAEYDDQQARRE